MSSASHLPIALSVSGADPVTRAGIELQLRDQPGIRTFPPYAANAVSVTLVVADEVDIAATAALRSAAADGSRAVLLVGRVDDAALLAAVEAGAVGVVRRTDATASELLAAIRAAAGGQGSLPPDLLGRLMAQVGRHQRQVLSPRGLTFSGLNEREIAVLRLLADGHDTAEIGQLLYYSERTIKNIVHDVTTRLELRNRSHAVAYAIRAGLI